MGLLYGDTNCPASAQTLAALPGPCGTFGAARGLDGRIYAMCENFAPASVDVYDPSNNSWTVLPPIPNPRFRAAIAAGRDGRIYAIGGISAASFLIAVMLSDVEAFSPTSQSWSPVAPMPSARTDLAAATGPDGRIYAVGGSDGVQVAFSAAEAYDPVANSWATLPPLPTARAPLQAATGLDGRIYTVGAGLAPNDVEAYDPKTNSWSCSTGDTSCPLTAQTLRPLPTPRTALAVTASLDGRVFAIGGFLTNVVEAYTVPSFDTTPPVIQRNAAADSCSLPGNQGWCRGTQTAGFSASDAGSGVASPCTAAPGVSCNFTRSTTTNGSAVSIASGPVCDAAGNCNLGINAGPFKIDSVARR